MKVAEDERIVHRFKKEKNFDDLDAAVKEGDDYSSTEYDTDEKEA